jgi:hypothetical protein
MPERPRTARRGRAYGYRPAASPVFDGVDVADDINPEDIIPVF